MIFAHRTNTFESFYKAYFVHNDRQFEIDVQPTMDGRIIVYHDDISCEKYKEMKHTLTLDEFLKFTPDSVVINVEIKKYEKSKYIVDKVLQICGKYPTKTYLYSSFDAASVQQLQKNGASAYLLVDKIENYKPQQPNICIHKNLLKVIDVSLHKHVFVYDIKSTEVEVLKEEHPFVHGWIIDR